jgi:hypothetical protein
MRKILQIILSVLLMVAANAQARGSGGSTIYDPNPDHLWNRLNQTLFERTAPDGNRYGLDQLDILYWARTTNLLAGVPHAAALTVLDEFNQAHGEKLIRDPLKKALLQRDLWALFDWAAVPQPYYAQFPAARRGLLSRLAVAIQRLELTTNEIAALPDNYALAERGNLADLPHEMFNPHGDWINVWVPAALGLVPTHDFTFAGRSTFTVLFHDADGRAAGLDYLQRLHAIEPMFVGTNNTNNPVRLNEFPQFPTNSQWALVRRLRVIDTEGKIHSTHLVESIQLRTYLRITDPPATDQTTPLQRFNEFEMTRPSGTMISLGQKERAFIKTPFANGIDFLEVSGASGDSAFSVTNNVPIPLASCLQCHSGPGIYSVNSFTRIFSFGQNIETTEMVESEDVDGRNAGFFAAKENRADWGLLQGLWMQGN